MSESFFDSLKNYYVFRYIVDSVSGEPTEYEGDIVAFVKATNPWEAVEAAGYDDMNQYGAKYIDDDLDKYVDAIAEERKILKKISKQLKEMVVEHDEQRAELEKELREKAEADGATPEEIDAMLQDFKNRATGK
jgi:uncharacterized Ntn-hydrolase superfamily protein